MPGGLEPTTLNISPRPDLIMAVRSALWHYDICFVEKQKESTQRIIYPTPDNIVT